MSNSAGLLGRHPRHVIAAALVLGLAVCRLPELAVACIAVCFSLCVLALRGRFHVALMACAVMIVAGAAGQARLHAIDSDPLAAVSSGAKIQLRGFLLEHPRSRHYGITVRARVAVGVRHWQTIEIRTHARMSTDTASGTVPTSEIGDEIVATGRLKAVDGPARTPEARSFARYLLRNGVRRRLQADSIVMTGRRRSGPAGFVDEVRRRSERTLATGLAAEPAALLRGMVLGGDNGIPETTTDAFRVAGLTHILAVSGQNVLLLIILVQAIATASGLGRLPRLLIPIALICIYVPLCGAQASVVRAGAMGLAGLVAMSASRPSSRAYALFLGAIAVLAYNPRATADVGAQLSFAAVLGIMAFTRPLAARLRRWPRWAAEAFAATAGATLATAPLMAYHFGTLSLVSLAANVLAAPLIGPIVWLGSLAAAVGQAWPDVGAMLNAPNEFLLASLITLAKIAAAAPGAQVELPQFGELTLALLSLPILSAAALVNGMVPHWSDRVWSWIMLRLWRPLRLGPLFARSPALRAALLPTAVLLAAVPLLLARPPATLALPRPSIVFLDVGQGDATLLLGTGGCEALIDGGPPGRDLPKRLKRLGVDRLELVVVTHPQLDHDGGLGEIARAGKPMVAAMFDGGGTVADERIVQLRRRLSASQAAIEPAEAGRSWRCGDLGIEVLGPAAKRPDAPAPSDPNTRAAVTIVDVGGMRLLASGDAESPQLLPLPLPSVDVLKVPHHGSEDPGLPAVLARIRPDVAVIQVGSENRYGHPTPLTQRELADAGANVLRTDRDGTVVVAPSPDGPMVTRHAE